MALEGTDLFMIQRSGNLRRTTISNLQNLQDTDLIMVQASDQTQCRKTTWGNRNNLADDTVLIVGRGTSVFKTTWAEVKGFLAITATIFAANNGTSTNENVVLNDLFTPEELASATAKQIIVENGAIVGGVNTTAAFQFTTDNTLNGNITLINNGHICGQPGGPSGTATQGVFVTASNVTIINNGTISSGGGRGGQGGKGGNSSVTQNKGGGCCATSTEAQGDQNFFCVGRWGAGAICIQGTTTNCSQNVTGNTCCTPGCGGRNPMTCQLCTAPTAVEGTNGGEGGRGAGYVNGAIDVGQAGFAAAQPDAGGAQGGTGGTGGPLGGQGLTGETGANGNVTNGSAGEAGVAAVEAINKGGNTVTVTNNGTINGSVI